MDVLCTNECMSGLAADGGTNKGLEKIKGWMGGQRAGQTH